MLKRGLLRKQPRLSTEIAPFKITPFRYRCHIDSNWQPVIDTGNPHLLPFPGIEILFCFVLVHFSAGIIRRNWVNHGLRIVLYDCVTIYCALEGPPKGKNFSIFFFYKLCVLFIFFLCLLTGVCFYWYNTIGWRGNRNVVIFMAGFIAHRSVGFPGTFSSKDMDETQFYQCNRAVWFDPINCSVYTLYAVGFAVMGYKRKYIFF